MKKVKKDSITKTLSFDKKCWEQAEEISVAERRSITSLLEILVENYYKEFKNKK